MKRESNLQENQKEQQNFQALLETCKKHQEQPLLFLDFSSAQSDSVFKCCFCVEELDNLQLNPLIPLQKLIASKNDEYIILQNYPFTDPTFSKKLKFTLQNYQRNDTQIASYEKFFADFISEITSIFKSTKARIIEQINKCYESKGSCVTLQQLYNSISQKQQLRDILIDSQKPFADKSAEIHAIFRRVMSKEKENIQTMQETINGIFNDSGINFEFFKFIKESVLQQLLRMHSFLEESSGNYIQKKEQLNEKEEDSSIQKQEIGVNKKRNSLDSFKNTSEEISSKYLAEINRINSKFISNLNNSDSEVISMEQNQSNISQYKADEISNLIEELSKRNSEIATQQQQQSEKRLNEQDQSHRINISRILNMSIDSNQKLGNILNRLLAVYPKIEKVYSHIPKGIPLPMMTFALSNHSQSQDMKVNHVGQKVIISLGARMYGQCVSKVLQNDRAYSLKVHFNRPFGLTKGYHFRIGLLAESLLPKHWVLFDQHEAGFHSALNCGARIIQEGHGGLLTSEGLRNKTSQLEFRWCIANQEFFYADATYENVNQAKKSYFNVNERYCFVVNFQHLEEPDWVVTLSDFVEIKHSEVSQFK